MSAQSRPLLTLPLTATDFVHAQRFVDFNGAQATAAGNAMGVALHDSSSTSVAIGAYGKISVVVEGTAQVEASAAISAGALVEAASDGKAVTRSSGVALGRALEAAPSAGAVIEVLLHRN